MGIWDIGYGGFVNGTGIIEEELGRYNQEKLGRIHSMLAILEKSDIKLMFAIWPHYLFPETVWAAEWDKIRTATWLMWKMCTAIRWCGNTRNKNTGT